MYNLNYLNCYLNGWQLSVFVPVSAQISFLSSFKQISTWLKVSFTFLNFKSTLGCKIKIPL